MNQHQEYRYAVYLIPPYSIANRIAEVHQLLRKQFGFIAADRFQVHATVKGFFKMQGDLESLTTSLDGVFVSQHPFPVSISGYRIDQHGIGLNIAELDGVPNQAFFDFQRRIIDAVRPAIAPDCDFSPYDMGTAFEPHITLAFRDISPEMHADVLGYLEEAPVPNGTFTAHTFHFLAFTCDDWNTDWAASLQWQLLKSWRLQP